MAGPFTDNDAVKFDESVKAFEAQTGIDIQYSCSKEFEASISIAISASMKAIDWFCAIGRPNASRCNA